MSDADILPYDYVAYAKAMHVLADTAAKNIARHGWHLPVASLTDAIDQMARAAQVFTTVRDSALMREVPLAKRSRVNGLLLQVERAFVRPQGLRNRSWYRNVIYAADDDNGYANIGLPTINEAVRAGDQASTTAELTDLTSRFQAATRILMDAAQSLR
jgi:N-acetylated-alpha-linked acidic dipeptidase